jgi:hypothetical protein
LYRKSDNTEARLADLGHVLMENRHGLIMDMLATTADGTAARDAAMLLLRARARAGGGTIGADKNYDTRDLVDVGRDLGFTRICPESCRKAFSRNAPAERRLTLPPYAA